MQGKRLKLSLVRRSCRCYYSSAGRQGSSSYCVDLVRSAAASMLLCLQVLCELSDHDFITRGCVAQFRRRRLYSQWWMIFLQATWLRPLPLLPTPAQGSEVCSFCHQGLQRGGGTGEVLVNLRNPWCCVQWRKIAAETTVCVQYWICMSSYLLAGSWRDFREACGSNENPVLEGHHWRCVQGYDAVKWALCWHLKCTFSHYVGWPSQATSGSGIDRRKSRS